MSAQGPPYASGPPSPRDAHAPKGANPLKRRSDTFERQLRRVLMIILVLGLPTAAISAGLTAYEASMSTVRVQRAERHEVTARLTASVKSDDDRAKRAAQVRWTDGKGVARTGAALVRPGTPEGAAVRVWVNRDGTIVAPPMSTLAATTSGWFVGVVAAFGVAVGTYGAWAGTRLVLDRGRYARWDAEWDLVEPRWSGRFHP
ncbi:Rv1733c family protein [Streptomyces coriariae]|uniref:Rv1733c family protein n=1 Tax=Streptomyces coriariae TaxID=2864460 RepID=UPI001E407915|nr:hypothetical protein [Streptomyces coriariae]